jgi:hypothetical protein
MAGHSHSTSLRSAQQELTKHHLKTPRRLGLLSPYKRAGQGSTTREGGRTDGRTTKKYKRQQARRKIEIDISSNHHCPLFSLFETWARRPLSYACNPYTSTLVQGNTNFCPPVGRRVFFCPNQDKPPCVLLASPFRKETCSIYSLV